MSAPSEEEHDSIVQRWLVQLAQIVSRRPLATVFCAILLCAACSIYSGQNLRFKTERADLIDPKSDYQRRWVNFTKNFGEIEDMVVVVESSKPAQVIKAMDEIGERMRRQPKYFSDVLYKVDPGSLGKKGLQYLDPEQLESLLQRLEQFSPVLRGQWDLLSLKSVFQRLNIQLQQGATTPEGQMAMGGAIHLATSLVHSLDKFSASSRNYQSPWEDLMSLSAQDFSQLGQVKYLVNGDGTMGFVTARPKLSGTFEGASGSVDQLRKLITEVQSRVSGTTIGLTGIPVLECDEMRSSEQAMMLESIVSYTGVSLLLIFGFRGFRHPFLAMMMLGIGMTCAFGFATLAVGHLNILSVSFVAIVVGLGIDYAILFLSRYMEVRRGGIAVQPAVVETSRQVGPGILTAAATTSVAFLCAIFNDFLGVSELGLIAGGGIILCAVAALVFMPAMVALMDRKAKPKQLPTPFQVAWLRETIWKKPLPVVLGSLAVVVWVGCYGQRVKYDYNLMNLQSQSMESVRLQKKIAEKSDSRLLYAVSMCDSPAEALELKKKFEALSTVHHVDEIASMLPVHPADQTQLMVQGVQVLLSRLPKGLPQFGPVDPKLVGQRMDELYQTLDAMKQALPMAQPLHQALDRFLDKLDAMTFEKQVALLTEYQTRISADLISRLRMLASVAHPDPVGVTDLPAGLATRFVGKQGQWLLQIHPKEQLWEVGPLRKFTSEVRSVDPDVTGTPLQNLEALQQIRRGYETVAVYALLACFLVLLVDFVKGRDAVLALSVPLAGVAILIASSLWWGHQLVASQLALAYVLMTLTLVAVLDLRNFCHIFLAMMPPLVGGAFTLGVLGLINVDLNPANLIILPLILGIGVDNGVHVLHDFRHQTGRYQCSPSLVNALFLTSFANMAGFASMILAAHQGLKSIGLVLTIGVGSCLFVSVVLLPSILTLMSARRESSQNDADTDHDSQGRNLQVYLPKESQAA